MESKLLPGESPLGSCGPPWWYYQYWFASASERAKMAKKWNGQMRWVFWGWWRQRNTCGMTDVLGLEGRFKKEFGNGWKAPAKSLRV